MYAGEWVGKLLKGNVWLDDEVKVPGYMQLERGHSLHVKYLREVSNSNSTEWRILDTLQICSAETGVGRKTKRCQLSPQITAKEGKSQMRDDWTTKWINRFRIGSVACCQLEKWESRREERWEIQIQTGCKVYGARKRGLSYVWIAEEWLGLDRLG